MEHDPDRWQRLSELVDGALAQPTITRNQWLRTETQTEPGLYDHVQAILGLEGESTGIGKAVLSAGQTLEPESDVSPGDRMGAYRVVRQIGKGGMGVVYEAVRCDDEFSHSVAIKLVARGAPQLVRRFRAERKLLAGLNHSNIARIFDGGTTGDGRPYFVMELVTGSPLIDYCREQKLALRDRLSLMVAICSAVQHAHERMIVHRDIKPGNILVTADGVPKLLDFGIAKAMDASGEDNTDATQTGAQMMTPDYASPEQVRGEEVTAATDVYALGAVLFEVLTGQKAHRFKDRSATEMARTICEIDPPRPSTVAPELRKQLAGDLDNIVLMAMRKEPARRYPSVRQFAEDIERAMSDRPVSARADTIRYRTSKFVRRNWWQVVAAAAIVVSLAAGLGFTLAAQRRTERRFNQVRQLANRFLFDFHDAIANTPGTVKAREMVVSTALEYLNSLSGDAVRDPGLQWELAVAYGKVANAQGSTSTPSLGKTRDAVLSYEKAFALARPLADRKKLDLTQRIALVDYLCDAETMHFNLFEWDAAVKLGQEAVERSEGLPANVQRKALNQWSSSLGRAGDLVGSLNARQRTLPIMRETARLDPSFENKKALAITLSNLGYFKSRLTRFDEAMLDEKESIDLFRTLQWKTEADHRNRMFTALYYLGLTEGAGDRPSLGRVADAMRHFREALAEVEVMVAADPHDKSSRTIAANAHFIMAYALLETAPEEAVKEVALADEFLDTSVPDDSTDRVQTRVVAAEARRKLHQYPKAQLELEEADRILVVRGGRAEADINLAWANLELDRGNREVAAGRFDRAIELSESALKKAITSPAAWALCRALELGAAAVPSSGESRRQRILDVWTDQNRRFPGTAFIEKQLAAARARR